WQVQLRPVPVLRAGAGVFRRGAGCQRRQHGAGGQRGHQLQGLAPAEPVRIGGGGAFGLDGDVLVIRWLAHHSLPALSWPASQALVRIASVMIVRVQFLCGLEANTPPSITNRLGQSQVWPHWLVTESLGESPIRVVPTSWMISPPFLIAS